MPADNRFRHQEYHREPPTENWRIVPPGTPLDPDSPKFTTECQSAADKLRDQNVRDIYLVHGTLAGTDLTGFHRELKRLAPRFGSRMGATWKQLVDMFAGDMGNYTQRYAEIFGATINNDASPEILVRRFLWTSENHHFGRAEAALRLIVDLSSVASRQHRTMLWGHSHAGNVFAILTNLLGSDKPTRRRFFAATRPVADEDAWWTARSLLLDDGGPLVNPAQLDIVTFGTPIRYGWERRGYGRLLHIVNHRPLAGVAVQNVPFPPTASQLSRAEAGDYFQQIFIAGTNFLPSVYSVRKWKAERKLHKLLQNEVSSRKIWEALRHGRRLADDGMNVLVDYVASGDAKASTLGGHAVYTRLAWLPFHLQVVAQYLGSDES